MSEQGDTQSGSSPAPQVQIPKYRLDEEIAHRRRAEAEAEGLRNLLARAMPQAPAAPEDPEMVELKERDPVTYKKLRLQEEKQKQLSAAIFQQHEISDRTAFINAVGQEEANKFGQAVEQQLDALRKRGNHSMNRTDLYLYMLGQEAIKEKRQPRKAADPAQAAQRTQVDAPPSDPSAAQVPEASAALSGAKELSLEELEAKLKNQVF